MNQPKILALPVLLGYLNNTNTAQKVIQYTTNKPEKAAKGTIFHATLKNAPYVRTYRNS